MTGDQDLNKMIISMLMKGSNSISGFTTKPLDNERNNEWSRILEMINPSPPQFADPYPQPFKALPPQAPTKLKVRGL